MALVKDTNLKFRLSQKQKDDLMRLAKERGYSAGELILRALGLEGDDASLPAAAAPDAPDPEKEPGAAGIAELNDRMAAKRRKK